MVPPVLAGPTPPVRTRPTLFTVGHGQRTAEEFVAVLATAGIALLVDVRRFPGSRRHPQFGRDALRQTLDQAGTRYEWRGEDLGGRRRPGPHSRHPAWRNDQFRAYADHMDTPVFQQALEWLLAESAATPTTVMCAETLWWRCHRRLIADAATLRGVEVRHLLDVGSVQPHPLHPDLRADAQRRPVYDRNAQRAFDPPLEG